MHNIFERNDIIMNDKLFDYLLDEYIAEEGLFDIFKKPIKSVKTNIKERYQRAYTSNVNSVMNKIREECPEEIAKELSLRKNEMNKMINIIDKLARKYNTPGIYISSDILKKCLKPESYGIRNIKYDEDSDSQSFYYSIFENYEDAFEDDELNFAFLTDLLPKTKPNFNNLKDDVYDNWVYDSSYNIEYSAYDIHEWAWNVYGEKYTIGEISVRNYEDTKDFNEKMVSIAEDLSSLARGLQCFMKTSFDGDWDDGWNSIVFKPSDNFLKIARKYGYMA